MPFIDLAGTWRVAFTSGQHVSLDHATEVDVDPQRYMPIPVPSELHTALEQQGVIPDLRQGINTLQARWVEEQWWIYRHTFTLSAAEAALPAWLIFEQLDYQAIIALNGVEVGRHANAHRPCRLPVTGHLRSGPNHLTVCLESGVYAVGERPGAAYNASTDNLLTKRHWLRKPQYESGWDWNPRLLNVGITGAVQLALGTTPWIENVTLLPRLAADHAQATIQARIVIQQPGPAREATLRISLVEADVTQALTISLQPGENHAATELVIDAPQLWWPRQHGDQFLYAAQIELSADGAVVDHQTQHIGIRSVQLRQAPEEVGSSFVLEINGQPIFCKGANWVPPTLVPSALTPADEVALLQECAAANFTFLRIWGGGTYASQAFLAACDQLGILIWHDFPFASAQYPTDHPAFLAEVRAEITWAIRTLGSHPSLVVWCGNNEHEIVAQSGGFDRMERILPDYALYHLTIPQLLAQEGDTRPYWPSSPFSPGTYGPNDPAAGDQHAWGVGMPDEGGTDFWRYRTFTDRFADEGGYLGAALPVTLRQFLPQGEQHIGSLNWNYHDNAVNFWKPKTAFTTLAFRQWFGCEPGDFPLDDYLVGSGLLQSEALAEQITNYRRRMFQSAAAAFWMFADSWPTTHGWGIIDGYQRRRLAFHPVRRANAPVTVVVVHEAEAVIIFGVNDTPAAWEGQLDYGVFGVAGPSALNERVAVTIPANSSTPLAQFPFSQWQALGLERTGAYARLAQNGVLSAQHRLWQTRFSQLALVPPEIHWTRNGDTVIFQAPAYVWAVCLDLGGESRSADNVFDLLPDMPYPVAWPALAPDPVIQRTGNALVLLRHAQDGGVS